MIPTFSAQDRASKVDFGREVQPLFRQHCVGCHGPTQQMNGFRLDRRKDAMRGGTIVVIGPGNSEGSRLYQRLIGSQFGTQMPPTGALSPDHVATVKAWIDQGAEWPDDVSGETPAVTVDPEAARLNEMIRQGNRDSFAKTIAANPTLVGLKGTGGITPLMTAALYGDVSDVRLLLDRGADPNEKNEVGATALMWAAIDLEKTRVLLERGANVNARSDDGRTPLMMAAGHRGSSEIVKLLLDRGADPSAKGPSLFGETNPLLEAAYAGDEAAFALLVDRGADLKAAGPGALILGKQAGCEACVATLVKAFDPKVVGFSALFLAPPNGSALAAKSFLDMRGVAEAKDTGGRTLLMLASASDALPVEIVQGLIQRGADVNAESKTGDTALRLARLRGETPVVELLLRAGAHDTGKLPAPAVRPAPARSARAALQRSLPLLQQADVTFMKKSGCVSCHHNSVAAMAVATARRAGIPFDDTIAGEQLKAIGAYIESWRESTLQGIGIPGDSDTISYILLGMAAEGYPADAATDALARFLKNRQARDGRWWILAHRPPIESSDIQVTAASMRALQVYAPRPLRATYEPAIRRAATWLMNTTPATTEEHAFHLLGLRWASSPPAEAGSHGSRRWLPPLGGSQGAKMIQAAARQLLAQQRADGGWSQLPTLDSDAYATGQALYALHEGGALTTTDPAYKRGVQFLLRTQLADGSWYVRTRALRIQPHFETGFPHGHDQFISAAATNWAAMALALSSTLNRVN